MLLVKIGGHATKAQQRNGRTKFMHPKRRLFQSGAKTVAVEHCKVHGAALAKNLGNYRGESALWGTWSSVYLKSSSTT